LTALPIYGIFLLSIYLFVKKGDNMPKLKQALNVNPAKDIFKSEKICLKVLIKGFSKVQRRAFRVTDEDQRANVSPPFSKREKKPMGIY